MTSLAPYYLTGASLSLIASLFVIFSYLKFKELRKHPSSIIFWRSIFDVFFSIYFIVLFAWDESDEHCPGFSFAFQFLLLGSQSWYFMIAIDLMLALRSPFTEPRMYLKFYHMYVWTFSLLTSSILVGRRETQYREGLQICWSERKDGEINAWNWLLIFVPLLIYWATSCVIIVYAAIRLGKGLAETFKIRRSVLKNGQRYVLAFTAYWTVAGAIYLNVFMEEKENDEKNESSNLELYGTFALIVAIRGFVDSGVWVWNQRVLDTYRRWLAGAPMKDEIHTDINRALRKEVLKYSTQGICTAIDEVNERPLISRPTRHNYPNSLYPGESNPNVNIISLDRSDSEIQGSVPFHDFAPDVFRYIRSKFSITEADYKQSIRGDTNVMIERFTEGASGSFFYFSEDSRYIVKTLTLEEAHFLVTLLPSYVDYMATHPHSLITKFLGFHSIRMYNLTLYFVVMESVFLTSKRIHQKYDIKGSWVNRHAKNKKGVLKDRDLNFQLSLTNRFRSMFLEQVTNDAHFLQAQGIMDYSLLIGIHNTRHLVSQEDSNDLEMNPFYRAFDGGIQAKVIQGPGMYFFGIIDILQQWNTGKKLERFAKTVFKCQDPDGISAVEPDTYSQRFIHAMWEITEPDDDSFGDDEAVEMPRRGSPQKQMNSQIGSSTSRNVLLDAPRSLNDDSEVIMKGDIQLNNNENYFE